MSYQDVFVLAQTGKLSEDLDVRPIVEPQISIIPYRILRNFP